MDIYVLPIELSNTDLGALEKSMKDFHNVQSEFKVRMLDAFPYERDTINWEHLANLIKTTHPNKNIIGVTSKGFDDNWFSHLSENVCAVSVFEWNKYFRPPGPQCYLLSKLALAAYFFVTKLNEENCKPHFETEGCLFDMCENKEDIIWKLKVGVLCNSHVTMFRHHGGSDNQLIAIELLLDEVRRVTLGKQEVVKKLTHQIGNTSEGKVKKPFNWTPAVFLALCSLMIIGTTFFVVNPKDERIDSLKERNQQLKEKVSEYKEELKIIKTKVPKYTTVTR